MPKRLALILACGLGIAACGSSSNDQTNSRAKRYSQALAFSNCMRAHGVSNFPDPSTGSGGRIKITIRSGPGVQSAQSSCKHLLPNGGQPSAQESAQAKAQLLHISHCMRAHRITDFPDPQTGSPPSNSAGYSTIMGTPGGYLAIPSSIDVNSPAFKQAATACQFSGLGA